MKEPLIRRLYDKDNYFVLKDYIGNVFAYRESGDKGTQEYSAKNIDLDELPDKVQEEIFKELI